MKNIKHVWRTAIILFCMTLLLSITLILSASAETVSGTCGAEGDGSNLTWTLDTDTGVLTISGTGAMKSYSYSSAPWYSYRSSIKTVTISDGVTSIGDYAFHYCSSLTSIELPAGVTSMGDGAFSGCSSLKDVYISDIASWCNISFADCFSDHSNPFCYANNMYINGELVTELVIPEGVTNIGNWAFCGCESLTSIMLPESLTSIGDHAFYSCKGLTSITIPESVTSIGYEAFCGCQNLESITFLSKTTIIPIQTGDGTIDPNTTIYGYIGSTAEEYATEHGNPFVALPGIEKGTCGADGDNLTWTLDTDTGELTISGTGRMADYTDWDFIEGSNAPWIHYASAIKSVTISSGITYIGMGAFSCLPALTTVTFDKGLTVGEIGAYAFRDSTNIKNVYISDIDEWCNIRFVDGCEYCDLEICTRAYSNPLLYAENFYINGDLVEDLIIPEGIEKIEKWAFFNYDKLNSVVFPESLTSIDGVAFGDCTNLTSVCFSESYPGNIDNAFYNCQNITNISFSSKTSLSWTINTDILTISGTGEMDDFEVDTNAPWSPFWVSIKSATISEGVTSIGSCAFYGCRNLESITIPESVTSIGDEAFWNCSNLVSVTFLSKTTFIADTYYDDPFDSDITVYGYIGSTAELYAKHYHRPFAAISDIAEGVCGAEGDGSNLTWAFDSKTGLLTISGTGEMRDYDFSDAMTYPAPWHYCDVKSVKISEGITVIGGGAFKYQEGLTSVILPESLAIIRDEAFLYCDELENIFFLSKTATVGPYYGYSYGDEVIPSHSTIYGYIDSTAEEYAEEYDRSFVPLSAHGTCGENLTWILISDGRLIIDGSGAMDNYKSSAEVPWFTYYDSIKTVKLSDGITTIGDYAFRGLTELTAINTPSNLTSIGKFAFYNCCLLKNFVMPEGITTVGDYAFRGCTALSAITLPTTLESIGNRAFSGCTGLKSISFQSDSTAIYDHSDTIPANATISGFADSTAEAYAEKYNKNFIGWSLSDTGVLTVSGIGNMGNYTQGKTPWYASRYKIKEIVIDEGITSVGDYAFYGCSSVTKVTIPSTVTEIGVSSFALCSALTEVSVSQHVTEVKSYAFYKCNALTDIYFYSPKTILSLSANTISSTATIHCPEDSNAEQYAIKYNRSYVYVMVSLGTGSCGENATWELFSDGRFVISGEGATTDYAIQSRPEWYNKYRDKIKTVVVDEGITKIGAFLFQGHGQITEVSLPSTLTEIGVSGFALCASLTELHIPENVTLATSYAFNKSGLTDIYVYARATEFNWASQTMPQTTKIHCIFGSKAEAYAQKNNRDYCIECIVISDGTGQCGDNVSWEKFSDGRLVISGNGAMSDFSTSARPGWYNRFATQITKVIIEEGVTTIGANAFQNMTNLINVTIPSTVTNIGSSAFAFCKSLLTIDIPVSVELVQSYAFYNAGLTDIYFYSRTTALNERAQTLPESATIHCVEGSKAEKYAIANNRQKVELVISDGKGNCGENVTWEIFSNGNLVISGSGAMTDLSSSEVPEWYNDFHDKIETVIIEEGVTAIGANTFRQHGYITSVVLSSTVKTIGSDAFASCNALTEIDIPVGVEQIHASAFHNTGLIKIAFLSDTTEIADDASTLPEKATVICGTDSAAAQYAKKYGRTYAIKELYLSFDDIKDRTAEAYANDKAKSFGLEYKGTTTWSSATENGNVYMDADHMVNSGYTLRNVEGVDNFITDNFKIAFRMKLSFNTATSTNTIFFPLIRFGNSKNGYGGSADFTNILGVTISKTTAETRTEEDAVIGRIGYCTSISTGSIVPSAYTVNANVWYDVELVYNPNLQMGYFTITDGTTSYKSPVFENTQPMDKINQIVMFRGYSDQFVNVGFDDLHLMVGGSLNDISELN